jgi:O-antigen/teichoic acid export membrane protein
MSKAAARNLASGGVLSLVRLVAGVLRVKLIAISLGVSGVGQFALILQLYATGVALVSLSLAVPIINLGRRHILNREYSEAGNIVGTAAVVLAFNALLLTSLSLFFGSSILSAMGLGEANVPIWPIALSIVIGAFSSALWEGLAFLSNRFDLYVKAGIFGVIFDACVVGFAAYNYGLKAAIFALPLGASGLLLAYVALIPREHDAMQVLKNLHFRTKAIGQLLGYSATMFVTVSLNNIGLTFLRSNVLRLEGAEANGNLQVVTAIASYLLAFSMTGFWGNLHAKAAAQGDVEDVRIELRKSLEMAMLVAFSGCGLAIVFGSHIVPLFYTSQFKAAPYWMANYMVGEFAFQLLSMMLAYLLAVGQKRRYIIGNLIYLVSLLVTGMVLLPMMGALGYVIAHIISAIIICMYSMTLAYRLGQVTSRQCITMVIGIMVLAIDSTGVHYLTQSGRLILFYQCLLALPFFGAGLLFMHTMFRGRN